MTSVVRKRLFDALNACRAIQDFVGEQDFTAYEQDPMLRSAVERQFEIIGEALGQARHEDDSLPERLPELSRIVVLRNRVIHGYDTVDDEIIWDIVQTKVPVLSQQLRILLDEGDL